MINHTPQVRRIVRGLAYFSIGLGLFTFLVVGIFLAWNKPRPMSCQAWMDEVVAPLDYQTTIVNIEIMGDCKTRIILEIESPEFLETCDCETSKSWEKILAPGNTIIKEKNTLTFTVSGDSVRTYPYPCCE